MKCATWEKSEQKVPKLVSTFIIIAVYPSNNRKWMAMTYFICAVIKLSAFSSPSNLQFKVSSYMAILPSYDGHITQFWRPYYPVDQLPCAQPSH